jgi:hypothetical protein
LKYLQMGFLAFLFVFAINFVTTGSNQVLADDDDGEKYEYYKDGYEGGENDDDGPYEDLGKTVGWGTVVAMGAAAVIFPVRRSMKSVITNFPGAKSIFISFSKFLGKYHIFIGVTALALSIVHGVTMYLNEGELESEGLIGLGSVAFMTLAGILGAVLTKKKKSKSLRTTHTILIAFAIIIGIVHILGA